MQLRTATALILATLTGLPACAGRIDKVVKNRAVPQLAMGRDLELACAFGSVGVSLAEIASGDEAQDALAVSWLTAGICEELAGREAQLQGQLARVNAPMASRAAMATDARIRADRHFAVAAARYQRAYLLTQEKYGGADSCALDRDTDASLYTLGLLSGMLALVNDSAAGMAVGVPQNQILEIGRQSHCLDNERWWQIPRALELTGWLVIPGSGPADLDLAAELAAAAKTADAQGQGIPRALWLFTAANGGDTELVRQILADWPPGATAPDNSYGLIDEYGRKLAQFEADQLWIAERGHRAPSPPTPPPGDAASADPFGADPFGGDQFGAEPSGAEPSGAGPLGDEPPGAATPSAQPGGPAAPTDPQTE